MKTERAAPSQVETTVVSRCATPDQLEGFLGDRLEGPDRETVAAHIEACAACRQALEQLTSDREATGRSSSATEGHERDALLLGRIKAEGPTPQDPVRPDGPAPDRSGPACGTEGAGDPTEGEATRLAPPPVAYPRIPGFQILRELGRGGMGVVYEAEDERLGRRVALKVLSAQTLIHPKQVQRFEREAKAAARLHHTNIVPVFGVGRQDGYHYYVMQSIAGRGLDRVIDDLRCGLDGRTTPPAGPSAPVPPDFSSLSTLTAADRRAYRGVARVGLQVAEALHYAHRQGILHRDIKPSNLLLDATGNVWVGDFGLAKTPEAEDLTSTGDVLGTIRYMAPERFQGRCDARSDVYSLGLTLYELVALRPAYEASDRYELIERVRRAEPPRLGKRIPGVPRDVETIIHKAIAREPGQRYPTAGALAEDLRRFLEDRPIQARPVSIPERGARWCRRNPWAAAFLAAMGLGLIASTWQAFRATAAEHATQLERDRAERSRNRALASVNDLLLKQEGTDKTLITEETRSYRRALIDAGLRESQELVRELENDPRAQLQLIEAYPALAEVQAEGGDRPAAIATVQKGITLAQALFDREHAISAGRSLGGALQQLGRFALDRDAGVSALRRSSAVFQTLLADHPQGNRAEWIQMIALNHYYTGDRQWAGRPAESVEAFLAARTTWKELLDEFGPSPPRSRRLGETERYLCRGYRAVRRFDDALAAGRRAIAILRTLVHDHPEDSNAAQLLYESYAEVGLSHLDAGRLSEAVHSFEEVRRTLKEMAARPGMLVSRMAQIQGRLAMLDLNLWIACDSDPARHAALRRAIMREAYEICDKLSLVQTLSPPLHYIYAHGCFHRADDPERDGGRPNLDLLRKAERLWNEILRAEPARLDVRGYLVIVRQQLADELAARGVDEEASRWRRDSLTTARGNPDLLCEIALEYARYAAEAGAASSPQGARRSAARRQRFERYAIAMLRAAIAAGYHDAGWLRSDRSAAPIRSLPEFQAVVGDLEFPSEPFARP